MARESLGTVLSASQDESRLGVVILASGRRTEIGLLEELGEIRVEVRWDDPNVPLTAAEKKEIEKWACGAVEVWVDWPDSPSDEGRI